MSDKLQTLQTKIQDQLYQVEQDGAFDSIMNLPLPQQAAVAYLHALPQIQQGGFIQLFHNGYGFLLVPLITFLKQNGAAEPAQILDDAIKYYVLHKAAIDAPENAEQFAKLYPQHPELDTYEQLLEAQKDNILNALVKAV